jgi:glycine/D-amino acid oxidase-like deaminating enzyme
VTDTADVLIVGCGAQGLSVARHAARRGLRVLAIDRVGPGRQTSQRAAGQSVIAQTDPAMGALMHRSISNIINFTSETGIALPYHQVGSVKYACEPWSAEQLRREVERATELGARVAMIDLDEAGRLAPHTDPSAAVAAWHAPDDIYFDPADLVRAMYEDGVSAGVDFRFGVEATGIVVSAGRVRGVETTAGTVSADAVVLATGNWTGPLLGKAVGLRLPLAYVRHQYSIRRGVPNIHADLPSVRVVDHAVYARPVGTDLMFGTYEPRPLTVDPIALPARTEHVPLDDRATNEALEHVGRLFPGVVGSVIEEMRGGVVTMTPDGSYVIDQCEDAAGLYFLTGCNVMGLSAAPALGEDVASWIADGSRPDSLTGFALSRFSGDRLGEDEQCRRGLREYEAIYRDALSRQHVRTYGG